MFWFGIDIPSACLVVLASGCPGRVSRLSVVICFPAWSGFTAPMHRIGDRGLPGDDRIFGNPSRSISPEPSQFLMLAVGEIDGCDLDWPSVVLSITADPLCGLGC